IVVNRQPVYLKQSMCSYFKGEELDFLLPYIDSQEWCDYNEQITISNFSKQKQKKKKQKIQTITCSWPIDQQSFWLSSLFGPRKKIDGSWGFHYGIDMAAMKGTPIKAAHAGNVIQAECVAGYGNTVVIQYNKNFKTRYAHLDTICVSKGQKIKKSNVIGTAGETGFIRKNGNDGSHLHFEVYKNGKQVDPLHNLPVIYGLI
ncbi:MAG: M23 family metallopeptidase, partial [Candidatus Babeliales bacterium]